jgi:hypothetical protein
MAILACLLEVLEKIFDILRFLEDGFALSSPVKDMISTKHQATPSREVKK